MINNKRKLVSTKSRQQVFIRDGYACVLCGKMAKKDGAVLEVDHIKPIAEGGSNELDNLRTLCRKCNRGRWWATGQTMLRINKSINERNIKCGDTELVQEAFAEDALDLENIPRIDINKNLTDEDRGYVLRKAHAGFFSKLFNYGGIFWQPKRDMGGMLYRLTLRDTLEIKIRKKLRSLW